MGKQRLSDALTDNQREALGRALAGRTAEVVERAGSIPLVVTADARVAEWATTSGFPSLPDPGEGLSAAARVGMEWAKASGSHWIVLHSDLPLLLPEDVTILQESVLSGSPVVAPSSDGGTSALGGRDTVEFQFGEASFHRHLVQVPDARVVVRPGLALDVDSPVDLAAAAATNQGAWLREFVPWIGGV